MMKDCSVDTIWRASSSRHSEQLLKATLMPNLITAINQRHSPYRLLPKPVEDTKITACLDAARWAASSYNEQPWYYIVAKRQDTEAFETALNCLVEANQAWAKNAGVLMLTVIRTTFRKNGKPNRVALHDLGAASAHMALQAAIEGLQIHQMAGVNLSQVRSAYAIPDGFEPQTAIAMAYPDNSPADDDDEMAKRDAAPRTRLEFKDFVFAGRWGQEAGL
jgi:nitroreductase